MKYNFIAGIEAEEIDFVSELLQKVLECDFERRYSSYSGEYNMFSCPEPMIVQYNYVEEEEEWDEPEFKSFHVLIIVGETDRPDYFKTILENLQTNSEIIKCEQWS